MGYDFSRTVTIDKTKVPNTDQSNFPVLFSGTYAYLATVANGGNVTNASGFDIIFTSDAAGVTKLDHEIESYAPTTGAVNFWVRVPTVSTTVDTVIYLWYGNAAITTSQENVTGVWDANFKGVWHLGNGTTLSGADSTGQSPGTLINAPTAQAGLINGEGVFNGSTQYINAPLPAPLSSYTWSCWAKPAALGAGRAPLGRNGTAEPFLQMGASPFPWSFEAAISTVNAAVGTRVYLVGIQNGSAESLYVDGVLNGTATFTPPNNLDTLNIGRRGDGIYFNGSIDEVRVSNIARSADWVTTEYNNQFSPSTFYAVSAVRPLVDGIAAIDLESSGSPSSSAGIALESSGRVPDRLALIPIESWSSLSGIGHVPLQSDATSSHPAPIALESMLSLPLSESATIVHRRRILSPFLLRMLHERTILATAPPFPSLVHTRSIFRSFLPMIHSRTIVPRSVILNAGLIESSEAQGGTLTTVILAPDASSTNGFYVGMWITIDGEVRQITSYNGGTRTATVATLSSPPIAGMPYSITVAKPGASKVLRPFATVTEA